MNNKKGISAIVATVLIILITVAAVTIIWAAIIPMIQENLAGSGECFDASAALSVASDYTCYTFNGTTNITNVQVHRSTGDFVLVGVDVIVGSQGTTKAYSFNDTNLPDPNGERLYAINLGTDFTSAPDEVSVAAVVKAGNTQKTCDIGGTAKIVVCA